MSRPVVGGLVIVVVLCAVGFAAIGSVVVSSDTPLAVDRAILQALEAGRTEGWTQAMLFLTAVGRGPVTIVATVLIAAWLAWRSHLREALFMALANLGSLVLSPTMKDLFARPRPPLDIVTRITEPSSLSFPSGHALSAIVFYTALAVVAARLAPRRTLLAVELAVVMIAGISLSRIYLGVHYPSDIVGGWLLGAAWVGLVFVVALGSGRGTLFGRDPGAEIKVG